MSASGLGMRGPEGLYHRPSDSGSGICRWSRVGWGFNKGLTFFLFVQRVGLFFVAFWAQIWTILESILDPFSGPSLEPPLERLLDPYGLPSGPAEPLHVDFGPFWGASLRALT